MPFINKSEATKRSKDRKINGKCTNDTNRRSRVWPVYFIYSKTVNSVFCCFSWCRVVSSSWIHGPFTVSAWNTSQPNDRQIPSEERSSSRSTFSFRIPPSDSDLFAPNLFGELEFRRILLCCAWCGEFDIRLDLSFWTPIHAAG